MGGLFSSWYDDTVPTRNEASIVASNQQNYLTRTSSWDNLVRFNLRHQEQHSISTNATTAPPKQELIRSARPKAKRSSLNPYIFNIIYEPSYSDASVVTFRTLMPNEEAYRLVNKMITNKRNFKVDSIEEIRNPYLKKAYELKKEEKKRRYRYVSERLLFHGTKHDCVDNICKMNFDWRKIKKCLFGRGISFSPNSTYASNYSDKKRNKVMLVALVLIVNSCVGNPMTVLPEPGFDTTHKENGMVIVKYEDEEYYPKYKINYHLNSVQMRGHYS